MYNRQNIMTVTTPMKILVCMNQVHFYKIFFCSVQLIYSHVKCQMTTMVIMNALDFLTYYWFWQGRYKLLNLVLLFYGGDTNRKFNLIFYHMHFSHSRINWQGPSFFGLVLNSLFLLLDCLLSQGKKSQSVHKGTDGFMPFSSLFLYKWT